MSSSSPRRAAMREMRGVIGRLNSSLLDAARSIYDDTYPIYPRLHLSLRLFVSEAPARTTTESISISVSPSDLPRLRQLMVELERMGRRARATSNPSSAKARAKR